MSRIVFRKDVANRTWSANPREGVWLAHNRVPPPRPQRHPQVISSSGEKKPGEGAETLRTVSLITR